MRVLVVEDEAATRDILERGLREEQVQVEAVGDATSAESRACTGAFDAIVLDVCLPDHDGFTLCRRLRARGIDTPVLLLTGRSGLGDRVRGLDVGGDDYLAKPFAFAELLARLRAVTRRGRSRHLGGVLSCGSIELDQRTRHVTVDKKAVFLSHTEFRLLEYLMRRADDTVSRDDLALYVWDGKEDRRSNVVDVYVSYLRKKLGPGSALIRTVRGMGYTMTAQGGPRG